MLGSSYPILNFFWTMLIFFLFIIWIFILIQVIMDVFRSHDMHGGAKALWLIFIILLPCMSWLRKMSMITWIRMKIQMKNKKNRHRYQKNPSIG